MYSKHINNNLSIKKLENIRKNVYIDFIGGINKKNKIRKYLRKFIEIWLTESASFYIGGSEKLT